MSADVSRRNVLKGTAAVAAGSLAGLRLFDGVASASSTSESSSSSSGGTQRQPNIVFIITDETRFPTVFPAGINTAGEYLAAYMPNLYQLWSHGVKFRHHYSAGVACSPGRAAIVTGLYPHQTWMLQTRKGSGGLGPPAPALKREFPTYGKILRDAGYDTPYVGKWHLSDSNLPNGDPIPNYLQEYGFQGLTQPDIVGVNGDGYRYDGQIAAAAADWLSKRKVEQGPFCLTVGLVNAHDREYFWGGIEWDRFNSLYTAQGLKPVADFSPAVPEESNPPRLGFPTLPPNWESIAQLEANKPSSQVFARRFTELVWGGIDEDPNATGYTLQDYPIENSGLKIGTAPYSYWERGMDSYTQVLNMVDAHIGTVVGALSPEVAANTVIVFTSDHGDFSGAHGFPANKAGTVYDEAFNVPLVVTDLTGRYTGDIDVERRQLTSSVDLLPMFASLATGGQGWRSGDLADIYGERLDLTKVLRSNRERGRRALVMATDEVVPIEFNFNKSPRYILGLRTPTSKLGLYSDWLPGTATIDPKTIELEYYDYATERGRLELDNTPDDPRAKVLAQQLLQKYVPTAMEAPLPGALKGVSALAKDQFLAFVAALDLLNSPYVRNGNLGKYTPWGRPF